MPRYTPKCKWNLKSGGRASLQGTNRREMALNLEKGGCTLIRMESDCMAATSRHGNGRDRIRGRVKVCGWKLNTLARQRVSSSESSLGWSPHTPPSPITREAHHRAMSASTHKITLMRTNYAWARSGYPFILAIRLAEESVNTEFSYPFYECYRRS